MPVIWAAFLIGRLVESAGRGEKVSTAWVGKSIGILMLFIFLRFLFDYLRARFQEAISYELIARDRLAVGDALKRVSLGYFQNMNTSTILNSITTGLHTLEGMGIRMIDNFVGGYLNFVCILLWLTYINWKVGLIAIAGAVLSLVFLLVISRYSTQNAPVLAEANRDLTGATLEYARGLAVVKSFGRAGASMDAMRKACRDSRDINLKIEWGYIPFNALHLLALKTASVAISVAAFYLGITGQLDFTSVILVVLLSFHVFGSLEPISDCAHVLAIIDDALNHLDALTGAYNRRYYEDRIRKVKSHAGVAMIDLDDFKLYNDTCGHNAGDMVLNTVVGIVRKCIRKTDILIRYGGDEFLLILPDVSEDVFSKKLKQIRDMVYEAEVPGYTQLHLSVSIGGVLADNETVESAVGRADSLMYQAKNRKNMVVTAGSRQETQQQGQAEEVQNNIKQQILIVDDSALNREILSEMLHSDFRILEAENGLRALELFNPEVDLVILDIMMPGMSGLRVCEELRKNSTVPILFLTAKSQESDKLLGLTAGGDDYLAKPFSFTELSARVKALLRRYCVYLGKEQAPQKPRNTTLEAHGVRLALDCNRVWVDEREVDLTETEYKILRLLMQNPQRIYSIQVIYETVWNEPYYYVSNGTVMVHIRNLRMKVEDDPQKPARICTVWGKGYRFAAGEEGCL